jgi:hypothetical protein
VFQREIVRRLDTSSQPIVSEKIRLRIGLNWFAIDAGVDVSCRTVDCVGGTVGSIFGCLDEGRCVLLHFVRVDTNRWITIVRCESQPTNDSHQQNDCDNENEGTHGISLGEVEWLAAEAFSVADFDSVWNAT